MRGGERRKVRQGRVCQQQSPPLTAASRSVASANLAKVLAVGRAAEGGAHAVPASTRLDALAD
ncbi:uncharacterized protein PgNI_12456, partial [Pyricularia grisea]|uniref:Uncharacterized protein n=1 Tax=Pyricularia grisea TaxID=148305 RepID=A0A6P8AMB8_PYRGI